MDDVAKCGQNKYYKKYSFGTWIVFNCTVTVLFSVLIDVHFYNLRFIKTFTVFSLQMLSLSVQEYKTFKMFYI
jgi:hypothetical protein